MIKITTKRIKEENNNEYIGISYKTKHTNTYEHLVLVNHLLGEIIKQGDLTKKQVLDLVKKYLGKEEVK